MKIKTTFFLFIFLITLPAYPVADEACLPYWRDMHVLAVNKQEPRTTFMSYDNKEKAQTGKYENAPYYKLLNGTWKFFYVDGYQKLPADITDPNRTLSDWHDIKVPGNWELQGFGVPVYINHGYEFQPRNPNPPELPDENAAGVYRRDIEIPANWLKQDIYLHLAAAKSGVYVYINGKEVGYSEDSKNPAEFLINEYVKEGTNTLVLKILRWSTGSYLECQDFFRISGIERDVFLWAQPKTSIYDFRVISMLDNNYTNGILNLELDLRNSLSTSEELNVGYELLDHRGNKVCADKKTLLIKGGSKATLSFDNKLNEVNAWNAEKPYLYKLLLSVEKNGELQEVIPFNVGFRKFEIKESDYIINGKKQPLFYVNGQPVKFKGVNIHEVSPTTGHYVTPEEMKRNFELMKLNNINAVRLSHYPQDRKFYEMCDEYGFYVYDEVNIESHGMYYDRSKGKSLGNNPDWLENHLFRTKTTYERNKNYPSVTILSLGNEAGNGYNFYHTYLWMKEKEQKLMNRPICYERALWEWNTDMLVPQYPSAAWLEEIGKTGADRPVIPSEYAHAMGNSTGDLYGQWNAIYKYPHLQGGFLWEWMDHALLAYNDKGEPYWAYGGDFGVDQPSDGNFVADGIIGPDQVPYPGISEVKYTHQNIGFKAIDLAKGEIEITNRFYFTDLSDYAINYKLYCNEKVIKTGELAINLLPQTSETVRLPVESISPVPGTEYFVNFEVTTRNTQPLIPKGHIVAIDQFQLPVSTGKAKYSPAKAKGMKVVEDDGSVTISSGQFHFIFDKKEGLVTSYKVNGTEYFKDGFGIQPNFWRAPNDNDYGNGAPKRLQIWKKASKDFTVETYRSEQKEYSCILHLDYLLPAGNYFIVSYEIFEDGIVNVSIRFTPLALEEAELPKSEAELMATHSPQAESDKIRKNIIEVPRIGVRFRLPKDMNHVEYFGRGPEENYIDRKMGTPVGLYSTTAEKMYTPYVRPQENGHKTDVRWLSLTKKKWKRTSYPGKPPVGI